MKALLSLQKSGLFIILLIMWVLSGCSGVKHLKNAPEAPDLHDGYKVEVNIRTYIILPLPDGLKKDDAYFKILRQPSKGNIWIVDRTAGFSYYTPKSGMYGYDYLIYQVVSGGKKVVKKIQFNIER
tara:strand:+ start:102 stop:479 length:378 start_codon:yes stop_codon:yes gene_type:complete